MLIKSFSIAKTGMKYYIPFHLMPLLLRLRKCKSMKQVSQLLGKSAIEYIRSILFMVFLVVGMKVGQCGTVHARVPYRCTFIMTQSSRCSYLALRQHLVLCSSRHHVVSRSVTSWWLRLCVRCTRVWNGLQVFRWVTNIWRCIWW